MPRKKINDLRNHLFEQMERLNDDELQGEALKSEIKRARAMKEIACQIVESAKVEVQYVKATKSKVSDFFPDTSTLPLNAVEPDKPKKLPLLQLRRMKPKLFLDTKTFLLHAVYQKDLYYLKICTCNEATLEQRRWAKEQIVKRCPVLAQVSAVS